MWSIPLYGSLAIHGYGVAICCGVIIAAWCATRHVWCREVIGITPFLDAISYAGMWGIVGGRALHVLTEWHTYDTWIDIGKVWEGGFSILGTVLAVLIFLPWYCVKNNIPLILMLDLCGLYAPLVHAVARVGCWSAGCCAGIFSALPWAIRDGQGNLIHPTQLYSSCCFFVGFLITRAIAKKYYRGSVIATYLVIVGAERFMVDWWRSDRIFMPLLPWFSVHQYIALMLLGGGAAILYFASTKRTDYEHISSG
jgi:phosphatidylglycerol:prolipoprotein diacylglycerol transferase